MILFSFILLISLIIDGASVAYFHNQYFQIELFLLCHFVALLFVLLSYFSIKQIFKSSASQITLLFFLISFFVPVLGIIASFLFLRWMIAAQKSFYRPVIQDYVLTKKIEPIENQYGVGGLRLNLKSTKLPLSKRTDALLSMSKMNPDKINNLIRTMLPDKEDEIRLLAFNLLKRQQKKVFPNINQAIELLKIEQDESQKAKLCKWLAHQYWEVIYRNLMEPELIPYAQDQTLAYAKKAVEYFEDDASLYLIIGRIALRRNQTDLAIEYFEKAIKYGMSEDRMLLYLAEAYYKQKKYHKVQALFRHLDNSFNVLVSKRLLMFWSKKHEE